MQTDGVSVLLGLLGLFGPLGAILALVILGLLSQRLGAVTKRPPLYRWLFVSAALIGAGIVERLLGMDASGGVYEQNALIYDALMLIALIIAVVIIWRYWSWLLYEHET